MTDYAALNMGESLAKDLIDGTATRNHDLTGCFIFSATDQGLKYWYNRATDLRNGKPLSKTAKLSIQRLFNGYRKYSAAKKGESDK